MNNIKGTTKIFGIIGNPVSHSISPLIHNFLARELNHNIAYVPFPIEPDKLKTAIDGAFALSICGLNVTVPFKQDVCNIISELDSEAELIGAVNTLKKTGNGYKGYNTDIYGMSQALKAHNVSLFDKTIVIIGAGGSGHTAGILAAKENASKIIIVNRTKKNSVCLAKFINKHYNNVKPKLLDDINLIDSADILIQTTPVGMSANCDDNNTNSPISDFTVLNRIKTVFDIIYTPKETTLLKAAKASGATTINGFEMLIYQAIKSYEIWNNIIIENTLISKVFNYILSNSGGF